MIQSWSQFVSNSLTQGQLLYVRVLSFFKGLLDLAHALMQFRENVFHKMVNRNAIESE